MHLTATDSITKQTRRSRI